MLGGDVGDEAAHKADEGGAVGVAGFEKAVAVEFAEHEAATRAGDGDAAAVVAAHFGRAVFPAHFQFGVVAFGVAAFGFEAAEFFEFAADDKGLVLAQDFAFAQGAALQAAARGVGAAVGGLVGGNALFDRQADGARQFAGELADLGGLELPDKGIEAVGVVLQFIHSCLRAGCWPFRLLSAVFGGGR